MTYIVKTEKIEAKICFRLLAMAQFIKANGEWGHMIADGRLLPAAFKYAQNVGDGLRRQIYAVYKQDAVPVLDELMSHERIKDLSLVFDELLDAENIDELLELIKQHKKSIDNQ